MKKENKIFLISDKIDLKKLIKFNNYGWYKAIRDCYPDGNKQSIRLCLEKGSIVWGTKGFCGKSEILLPEDNRFEVNYLLEDFVEIKDPYRIPTGDELVSGKSFQGFIFKKSNSVLFVKQMNKYIGCVGKIGLISEETKEFEIYFEDGEYFWYPFIDQKSSVITVDMETSDEVQLEPHHTHITFIPEQEDNNSKKLFLTNL